MAHVLQCVHVRSVDLSGNVIERLGTALDQLLVRRAMMMFLT